MSWKIYLADGSVFTSDQGDPEDAPNFGVLAILQGKVIEQGYDWYLYRTDQQGWVGIKGDPSLVLQFMNNAILIAACLAGETVTNEKFHEVMQQALRDRELNDG